MKDLLNLYILEPSYRVVVIVRHERSLVSLRAQLAIAERRKADLEYEYKNETAHIAALDYAIRQHDAEVSRAIASRLAIRAAR